MRSGVQNGNGSRAVTNSASVPLRSLFRYPGGKTWLVPHIRDWLQAQSVPCKHLVEPFAGGGIVGLTVAFEALASHVTFAEIDPDVAAVWRVTLSRQAASLATKVIEFRLTAKSVESVLSSNPHGRLDRAFRTILRNRVNHGGVMAPRAGRLKIGDGRGLHSRWYPDTLRRRILDIYQMRSKMNFVEGDGFGVIREYSSRPHCTFFVDPPYTAGGKGAGARLYSHSVIDHELLFDLMSKVKGDFLMTYDDTSEVRKLARCHGFEIFPIRMQNKYHAKMTELLVGRDLEWARKQPGKA